MNNTKFTVLSTEEMKSTNGGAFSNPCGYPLAGYVFTSNFGYGIRSAANVRR